MEQMISMFGGAYAVVRVDADDTVTLVEPVSGPLAAPGKEA